MGVRALVLATVGLLLTLVAGSAAAGSSPGPCGATGVLSVSATTDTCTYSQTGSSDTFTSPAYATSVTITAVGGQGGAGAGAGAGAGGEGGDGASVTAGFSLAAGSQLTLTVGGNGAGANGPTEGAAGLSGGGGGAGGSYSGGAGGDASSVSDAASGLLVVAGGGGGGGGGAGPGEGEPGGAAGQAGQSGPTDGCAGGDAGAPVGDGSGGGAASPAAGCSAMGDDFPGAAGTAPGAGVVGPGGAGGSSSVAGGGGGGGGYGGGGGGQGSSEGDAGGGGGGSSYTASAAINPSVATSSSQPTVVISWPLATPTVTSSADPSAVTVGSSVADQATVAGGYAPTGTVTFALYSNSAGTGNPLFTGTENLASGPITSQSYTTASAGTYYWVATYSGDSNNTEVSSNTASTRVTVNKASPSVSWSGGLPPDTTLGAQIPAATISALVSGGYAPGGQISFEVFGPQVSAPSSCAGGMTLGTDTVSGNAVYASPAGYTPTASGNYWFCAHYAGDSNNTTAESEAVETFVGAEPTLSLTVPASDTAGAAINYPRIDAVISGGHSPSGTITYYVVGPQSTVPTQSQCEFSRTIAGDAEVSGDGSYPSLASYTPYTTGDYWWYASYGGDGSNQSVTTTCGSGMPETVVTGVSVTPPPTTTTTTTTPSSSPTGTASGSQGNTASASSSTSPTTGSQGTSTPAQSTTITYQSRTTSPELLTRVRLRRLATERVVTYRLSKAGKVTFELELVGTGRKLTRVGRSVVVRGLAGLNTFALSRSLSGLTLSPGTYELIVTVRPSGHGSPAKLRFKVVG